MDSLLRDLRQSLRMLLKSPGFSLATILILALGITANSATFSIIQAALLNPLECEEPRQLIILKDALLSLSGRSPSGADLLDWGESLQTLSDLAVYSIHDGGVNLTGGGEPVWVRGAEVSASFFSTFRVNAAMGRTFIPEEQQAGRNRVVILSHTLWRQRFGAAADIVNKTIRLNEVPFAVIGVAPQSFRFPNKADLWIPIAFGEDRIFTGAAMIFEVMGRLKPEATMAEAQSEIVALRERYKRNDPQSWLARREVKVISLPDQMVGHVRLSLLVLWGAVGFVLLIACANVANLMLARGLGRQKEMAVRAALGASRRALFRLLLTESLLLALIAGGAGMIGAHWFLKFLVAFSPTSLDLLVDLSPDLRAIAFTFAVSALTGIAVGLAPGFQAFKVDLNQTLKESGHRLAAATGLSRVRNFFVVFEIALSLVLLIGAGLLIKSFNRLLQVDTGMSDSSVLTASIVLPMAKYPNPIERTEFYERLIGRLQQMPQIRSVGAVNNLPLGKNDTVALLFEIVGRPKAGGFDEMFASNLVVTPDYFSALGIPLVEGRLFTRQDTKNSKRVVIINQSFAKRFWSDESPVGKQLKIPGEENPAEVVGVAGDVKHFGLERKTMQEIYSPHLQAAGTPLNTLVARTDSDPMDIAETIRKEVRALDSNLPVYDMKTMRQRIDESTGQRRFIAFVLGIFAVIALILAAGGIYSVMAYSVSQRTNEIGVRMALGASRSRILRLIILKALLLAVAGAVIGVAAAIALTRVMSSLLYELQTTDLFTFLVTTLGLLAVALVASFLPAYRAMKVDPIAALRHE
ncbi:MAG: ABC transporter permease [Acidobacteriota bacterium]